MSKEDVLQGTPLYGHNYNIRRLSKRDPDPVVIGEGYYVAYAYLYKPQQVDHVVTLRFTVTNHPQLMQEVEIEWDKPFLVDFYVNGPCTVEFVPRSHNILRHTALRCGIRRRENFDPTDISWDDCSHIPRIKAFLDAGGNINSFIQKNTISDWSLFLYDPEKVRIRQNMWTLLMMSERPPSDQATVPGLTLLQCAYYANDNNAIQTLLNRGANRHMVTPYRRFDMTQLLTAGRVELPVVTSHTGLFAIMSQPSAEAEDASFLTETAFQNFRQDDQQQQRARTVLLGEPSTGNGTNDVNTLLNQVNEMLNSSTFRDAISGMPVQMSTTTRRVQFNLGNNALFAAASAPAGSMSMAATSNTVKGEDIIPHQIYGCKADVKGRGAGELTVMRGQLVKALEKPDALGWVKCETVPLGRLGFLPAWCLGSNPPGLTRTPTAPPTTTFLSSSAPAGKRSLEKYLGQQLRVIAAFSATGPGELSVKRNDIVTAMEEPLGDGWIKVKLSVPSADQNKVVYGHIPLAFTRDNAEVVLLKKQPSSSSSSLAVNESGLSNAPLAGDDKCECPICFEEMYTNPVGIFASFTNKRTCRHFLHLECANAVAASSTRKTCPICRVSFDHVKPLPDFDTNPQGWFQAIDFESSGRLSKQEVLDAFKALLTIDYASAEKDIAKLWPQWTGSDPRGISYDQLCSRAGLLVYVRRMFALMDIKRGNKQIPRLTEDMSSKLQWFRFFDTDTKGELSLDDIHRACCQTFLLGARPDRVEQVKLTLQEIWPAVVGARMSFCDETTFIKSNGLGDTLVASFQDMHISDGSLENSEKELLGKALMRQASEL